MKSYQTILYEIKDKKFYRLKPVEWVGTNLDSTTRSKDWFKFKCDCGKYTLQRWAYVEKGQSRSCGCYRDDMLRKNRKPGRIYEVDGFKANITRLGEKYKKSKSIISYRLDVLKWPIEKAVKTPLRTTGKRKFTKGH